MIPVCVAITIPRRNLGPLLKSPQPNSLPSKGKDLPHIMEQPNPLSPAHKALGYRVSTYPMVNCNIIKTFLFPMVNWQFQKGRNCGMNKLQVNLLIPKCERSYAWEKDICLPCQIKATAFWPKWAYCEFTLLLYTRDREANHFYWTEYIILSRL